MVVDIGASMTSVTPVLDGMVLKKGGFCSFILRNFGAEFCPGIRKSPLAGNFVSEQIRMIFKQSEPQIPLTPHYMVVSKTPVDAGAPAQAVYRKFDVPPTDSFRRHEEERVLTEFKESVVEVWPGPGRFSNNPNEEIAKAQPGRPFEMPDGWNQVFGVERYKAAEGLFDASAALTVSLLIESSRLYAK